MIEHRGVRIPATIDEWQLYDKPTSPEAAQALTKAACEAVDMIAETKIANAQDIEHKATKHMYDVAGKYTDNGASDTEPLAEIRHVVIRTMKVLAGKEISTWDL